jgi:hypothetical protein
MVLGIQKLNLKRICIVDKVGNKVELRRLELPTF